MTSASRRQVPNTGEDSAEQNLSVSESKPGVPATAQKTL